MIPSICINDGYRPKEIPASKWIKEGEQYHIIRVARMANQSNILGCELMEIELDESNSPFELFRLERFAIAKDDFEKMSDLIQMPDERIELSELLEQQLQEIE